MALREEYSVLHLTSVDMLDPIVSDTSVTGDCPLLLITLAPGGTGELTRVVPSLSIAREPGGQIRRVRAVDELYHFVEAFGPEVKRRLPPRRARRRISELARFAAHYGFELITRPAYGVAFLGSFSREVPGAYFEEVGALLDEIRRQSVNLLNDRRTQSLRDLERLEKELSPDPSHACRTIVRFLSSRFKVLATSYEYDHRDDGWIPLSRAATGHADLWKAVLFEAGEQIRFRKPVAGITALHHTLVIPFVNARHQASATHLVLLASPAPLPRQALAEALRLIDFYFNQFLPESKRSLLGSMRQRALDLSNPFHAARPLMLGHERALSDFVAPCFEQLLQVTPAFSCTVRLYDPATRSLALIVERMRARVRKQVSSLEANRIPLSAYGESVNATAFRDCNRDQDPPYLYVPDLEVRKHLTAPKTGDRFARHRKNARAEFCAPIYFKATKIGTVNIEAPVRRAFDGELRFLQAVVDGIGDFCTAYLDLRDKRWLAFRSEIHENVHSLERVIRSDEFPSEWRGPLLQYVSDAPVRPSAEDVKLADLVAYREAYLEQRMAEITLWKALPEEIEAYERALHRACKVNVKDLSLSLGGDRLRLLTIIYKNLIDNLISYSDLDHSVLHLLHHGGEREPVRFLLKSSTPFDPEHLSELLYRPVRSDDALRPLRYGMFIVGMLARQLSGFAYASNVEMDGTSELVVSVPLWGGAG